MLKTDAKPQRTPNPRTPNPAEGRGAAWQAGSVPFLFDDLSWRGLVHQLTDHETLPGRLDDDRLVLYIGFDPTASSLHVGHLQQICLLRRFQDAGHRPIALVGGGTGMIGDPSGKSEERNLLSPDELDANRASVASQLSRFLDFGGADGAVLADNAEWLSATGLLDFLRDVGKLFSVNEMIRKESVRARLEGREQSLSFTEFSYMLLQAWDFLQLYDRYGCELQLGGSDQWGNITEGIDLIRRRRGAQAYGLTSPLVTKADGSKFGKTESGNVWLDATLTSPYEFFQFWLRTSDAEVGSYLRRFTFLPRDNIEELERATAARPERREAQRALAFELTALVHGADEARRAQQAAAVLFTPEIATVDPETLASALADAPVIDISRSALEGDLTVLDSLLTAGLAESRSNARRLPRRGRCTSTANGYPTTARSAPLMPCTDGGSCCAGGPASSVCWSWRAKPRSSEVTLEAFVAGLEAVPVVEPVGRQAGLVAGELHPVTASRGGPRHRRLQQLSADAGRAVPLVDVDRLDLGTTAAAFLEMAEDDQLAERHDFTVEFCDQHVVAVGGGDLDQRGPVGR